LLLDTDTPVTAASCQLDGPGPVGTGRRWPGQGPTPGSRVISCSMRCSASAH